MLPLGNIIVKLFLMWEKSCFRTFLLPALKLKKETSHKLAKKLNLFSNPPSACHECMTGGVALSMENLPCTIWTLSPPICLPAASSWFCPCPLQAHQFGQTLDQLHLCTICTSALSRAPQSNFAVLWRNRCSRITSPLCAGGTVPGIIYPSSLRMTS